MSYMTIKKFAEKLGVTEQTLRNWDKSGRLKPAYRSESGYRYYSDKQFAQCTGLGLNTNDEKLVIGYCRVSTNKQKDNLERQVEYIRQYCVAKGYCFKIVTDVGSGIDYTKKGLQNLLVLIMTNQVSKVVIMYKDRLVRLGFELIETLCSFYSVDIEIIDNTEKTEQEELVEDLVQIVTVFGAKLSGRQVHRVRQIVTELKAGDSLC